VKIINNASYEGTTFPIRVTAQVYHNGEPSGLPKSETIPYNNHPPRPFDFGHGPAGPAWEIKIRVMRLQGSPPDASGWLSLVKKPDGGYGGKIFTITVIGQSFAVSS
jgi:hypothetical protein